MQNTQYIEICETILNNKACYQKADNCILEMNKNQFIQLIENAYEKDVITKDQRDFLRVDDPITLTFYAFPKVNISVVTNCVRN